MSAWETVLSAWMPDPGGDSAYQAAMESVVLSDAYARREAAALRFAFRSGFLLGVRLMAQDAP